LVSKERRRAGVEGHAPHGHVDDAGYAELRDCRREQVPNYLGEGFEVIAALR